MAWVSAFALICPFVIRYSSLPVAQTIPARILRIAPFEPQPRLLVTFLVQVMQQIRRGVFWQLARQVVEARKNREQVRLGIRGGHGLYRGIQLYERVKNVSLDFGHLKMMQIQGLQKRQTCRDV